MVITRGQDHSQCTRPRRRNHTKIAELSEARRRLVTPALTNRVYRVDRLIHAVAGSTQVRHCAYCGKCMLCKGLDSIVYMPSESSTLRAWARQLILFSTVNLGSRF